jgi:hypothetical protein
MSFPHGASTPAYNNNFGARSLFLSFHKKRICAVPCAGQPLMLFN